jgi:hypothetical protein
MEEFEISPKIPEQRIGWLETILPKSAMMKLESYIETAKKNPVNYNAKLVGNISKSLTIEDKDNWFFQSVLVPLIDKFIECFPKYTEGISVLTKDAPFCLDTFWVNFQKEHEFNPSHNHTGIWSFVIWVKIPTDWREQHALPISGNSNMPCASDFAFGYTSMLGDIQQEGYFLDKESAGHMLFFPAKLNHTVYPFYNCNKERISISGNIRFNNITF